MVTQGLGSAGHQVPIHKQDPWTRVQLQLIMPLDAWSADYRVCRTTAERNPPIGAEWGDIARQSQDNSTKTIGRQLRDKYFTATILSIRVLE